jgi:hypothetical protein
LTLQEKEASQKSEKPKESRFWALEASQGVLLLDLEGKARVKTEKVVNVKLRIVNDYIFVFNEEFILFMIGASRFINKMLALNLLLKTIC